jgi:hypothetical protein
MKSEDELEETEIEGIFIDAHTLLHQDVIRDLNHNYLQQTKITRRITMHKNTRSILGNPSQQGKKTQPILCYIPQEKDLPHHHQT